MFWKDSNTFPHFQKVSVSATASETLSEHHCAVGHSTSGPMRLLSSLLPTEQNPRRRTWFFTNRAVSPGLCTSWDVALGLCELSPSKGRHCSRPGPNCRWAPLRLTPIFRLPREEMGWWLLPLQWKPFFYYVKTSEL